MKPVSRIGASELSERLSARARDIVDMFFNNGAYVGGDYFVGDVYDAASNKGKGKGSCVIHTRGPRQGTWKDFSDDTGGDLLDLIAIRNRCSLVEAMNWARRYLGLDVDSGTWARPAPGSSPERSQEQIEEDRRKEDAKKEWALKTWHESIPAEGTPVEAYLRNRLGPYGPDLKGVPPSIRFHRGLKHGPTGLTFPALVAGVQEGPKPGGAKSRVTGIWRIWLTDDGQKAPVTSPKMGLGPTKGGAVRLGPAAERMSVTEGIENAVAAMVVYPEATAWATLSTSGMKAVELPVECRHLIVFADHDKKKNMGGRMIRPGLEAGYQLEAAAAAIGIKAKLVYPDEEGEDLCDWLCKYPREEGESNE